MFSQRSFRDALGVFPTGVAVVTANSPRGYALGVTVNSFSSVSLDPPLVSFNLAKSLKCFDELMECRCFAINILREDQMSLSATFGRPRIDKWHEVSHRHGETASPIIVPHLAVFNLSGTWIAMRAIMSS